MASLQGAVPVGEAGPLAPLTTSHVVGVSETPVIETTLHQLLAKQAAAHSSESMVHSIHQNEDISWHEMEHRVNCIAAGLHQLGYRPGDRLGMWAPNCWEWVALMYATSRLGVVLVNLNPANQKRDTEHVQGTLKMKGVVVCEEFRGTVYDEVLRRVYPTLDQFDPGAGSAEDLSQYTDGHLRHIISIDLISTDRHTLAFSDLLSSSSAAQQEMPSASVHTNPSVAANVQFTSGTTGLPKAATLSHKNIINNAHFIGERMNLAAEDRTVIPVPMFHCFGMVLGALASACHGASVVFPSAAFSAAETLSAVHRTKAASLLGVPTMFIQEMALDGFEEYDLTSLRTGIMAGTLCPESVMQDVIHRMHIKEMTICYGQTETSPVSWQTRVDDDVSTRCSTVGSVHPHVECRLVDPEGAVVPLGESGELQTKGYNVMIGYHGVEGSPVDEDGFFSTGDIGSMDSRGHLRIMGRSKDVIIRGGENIYPKEIEDFLLTHPRIQEVTLVGVPDERFGQIAVAFYLPKSGSPVAGEVLGVEELRDFCQGEIARYKVPSHVFEVSEFPMTLSGKIKKFELVPIAQQLIDREQ